MPVSWGLYKKGRKYLPIKIDVETLYGVKYFTFCIRFCLQFDLRKEERYDAVNIMMSIIIFKHCLTDV